MALALGPLGGHPGVREREGTGERGGERDGDGAVGGDLREGSGEGGGSGESIREGDCVRNDTIHISTLPDPSPPIHCEIRPLRSLFTPAPGRLFDRTFPFRCPSVERTIDIDLMYEEIKTVQ